MLLDVRDLRTHFHTRRGVVRAVDGVSLSVDRGETLGLVGESGSGKSVVCSSIMRLVPTPAGRIVSGQLWFEGEDLLTKSRPEMREIRGRKISLILQDPHSSLNPSFTVASQVGEAIRLHQRLRGEELRSSVIKILSRVGIPEAERRMKDFPHQLSGGMRQRVAGAIALSCQPSLLLADEPTTSLDVTVQAQYLRLLRELQEEFAFGLIFVTHDFGIVAKMCDQVAVMYAGRIAESGSTRQIFNHPAHPYSKALLSSIPRLSTRGRRLPTIDGQPPIPIDLPPGCSFAPRCPEAMEICRREMPEEAEVAQGHRANCWLNWDTENGPKAD